MKIKLLTVLLLGLCFSLFLMPGCKTVEDEISILGTWNITKYYDQSYSPISGTITFTGSNTSGSLIFSYNNITNNGSFTVTGSTINFTTITNTSLTNNHWGTIASENAMNGNFLNQNGNSGNWNANR